MFISFRAQCKETFIQGVVFIDFTKNGAMVHDVFYKDNVDMNNKLTVRQSVINGRWVHWY